MPDMTTMIIPLEHRIIVRLAEAVSQAAATAVAAGPLADVTRRGVVIAAGAGRVDDHGRCVPIAISSGDIILFRTHLGREMTFAGMRCWIIDADDVVKIEVSAATPLLRSKVRVPRP